MIELQQEFYQLFGHRTSIIYDCYTTKELLEHKIGLLMEGMRTEKMLHLSSIIWDQRKLTGDNCLLMSPIFVLCVRDVKIKTLKYPLNIKSKKISIHPLFRVRKCSATAEAASCADLCATFVDENARVYANWGDFCSRNKLDDSLIVAPRSGIYNGTESDVVILDIFMRESGITKTLDTGTTVVGLASAGVTAAALIPSVVFAPVVLTGALVAGISCAVYTGFRSAYDLYDRSRHQQSINITNRDARSSWINLAAGTLSASAAGATQTISKAIANGSNISSTAQNAVKIMNIGALSMHTTGCLDGIHSMLYRLYTGQRISKMHLAQLSCSLFMITHSVSNIRTARLLLQKVEAGDPRSMTALLCEEQRVNSNHLVNHAAAYRGVEFVIRTMKRTISNGDELQRVKKANEKRQELAVSLNSPTSEGQNEKAAALAIIEEMPEPVKIHYSRMFDRRLNRIVILLRQQANCRSEDSLRITVKYFLSQISMAAFEELMSYVQQLLIQVRMWTLKNLGSDVMIEPIMKFAYEIINTHADEEGFEKFLMANLVVDGFSNDGKELDFDIRNKLQSMDGNALQRFEKTFDEKNQLSENPMSTDREILLTLSEHINQNVDRFKKCCPEFNLEYLRETVENILIKLSVDSTEVFFDLSAKLTTLHMQQIQRELNRFIPIDIFIVDIYIMLDRLSGQDINAFLFKYTDDDFKRVEREFLKMYAHEKPSGKPVKCKSCAGEYFA